MIHLLPFQPIRTSRLTLRAFRPEDAAALFALRSDERVMRHMARPRATSVADAEKLIATIAKDLAEENGISWAITLQDDDTLIGTIGFYRIKKEHLGGEVGYLLHPDHWGKGMMGEALEAVVAFGFDAIGFHRIEADTDPLNDASNRLLERHGFTREAHLRENVLWKGQWLDTYLWGRLAHP
ncbi:MAG: GNAT family N-acetyltransferase [Flavobacteriales bacterium]|nr:GNAT family N-acetyltransferase [Flavobacteriales bacterium]